jgi:uncharacterized membrane protein
VGGCSSGKAAQETAGVTFQLHSPALGLFSYDQLCSLHLGRG